MEKYKYTFLTNVSCPKCGNALVTSNDDENEFLCHTCHQYVRFFEVKEHKSDYLTLNLPITNREYHKHYDKIETIYDICGFNVLGFDDTRNDIGLSWTVTESGNPEIKFPNSMTFYRAIKILNDFMDEIRLKSFQSDLQAVEYGRENNFGKHQFEKIKVNDENVILCGTDQAFEEVLWGDAYKFVEDFCKKFGPADIEEDDYSDFATDLASKIRDLVIKEYEEEHKVRFLNVWDEY